MSTIRTGPAGGTGFTLIEAMICLLLVSLLLAVAVPAWSNALARTHAASARAALLSSLTQAISHAAITGTEVVLCPSTTTDCADSWDWSAGWIAYADVDGDRRHDAGETLLHRQAALDSDIRLLTSKGRKRLLFQPNGGNAGSNVSFTLCTRRGATNAVNLVLANNGRLRARKPPSAAARVCTAAGG